MPKSIALEIANPTHWRFEIAVIFLVDVSDISISAQGEGKGKFEAPRGGGGVGSGFLSENPGRGGGL